MVGLSIVRDNYDHIMRRSKTSVQLKTNTHRRPSLQSRSPYFWNAPQGNRDTVTKTASPSKLESSSRLPNRRRSTDCDYRIWELGDVSDGMKAVKLIGMSESSDDKGQKKNYVLPPIGPNYPRLSSAVQSSRSEKSNMRRSSTTKGGSRHSSNYSKSNQSISNISNQLKKGRSSPEEFCHGLPREDKDDVVKFSVGPSSATRTQNTFSFGNQKENGEVIKISHTRATKLRASSLHSHHSHHSHYSRSSEGSSNSAAFRAQLSRRRLSLPVNASSPLVAGKSREFDKALQLSKRGDELNVDKKRPPRSASLLTLSDKIRSPASSVTAREAVPPTSNGDALQIIQEIPVESTSPIGVHDNNETDSKQKNYEEIDGVARKDGRSDSLTNEGTEKLLNDDCMKDASEDYKIALSALTISEPKECVENATLDKIPKISVTQPLDDITDQIICETDLNNNTNSNPPSPSQIAVPIVSQKAELLTASSLFGDDESIIDAAILNERDDDLCDADFREKRIIQWIISAETGSNVVQQVESAISPSPTNGSRETAITVIYGD